VLARSRRSVLVIDAGAPRNAPADYAQIPSSRRNDPLALLEMGRAEVRGYGGSAEAAFALRRVQKPVFSLKLRTVVFCAGRVCWSRRAWLTTSRRAWSARALGLM